MFTSPLIALMLACSGASEVEAPKPAPKAEAPAPKKPEDPLRLRAKSTFGTPPAEAENPDNPVTDAKIALGRALYYETRLSKKNDISCNTCHDLAAYGVDGDPTSTGHKGQKGGRNAPTVYYAAFHFTQFWDGRAKDVEAQAGGPVLNPIEMAMPTREKVVERLNKIEGYPPLFAAAFEGEEDPVTYGNMEKAIGAFERRLVTPAPFDAWLAGDDGAMNDAQKKGLTVFMDTGCTTCHMGDVFGGQMYQKLGLIKPWDNPDEGRKEVTGKAGDLQMFKVPSLRNIAKTGPYLHDGSISDLSEIVKKMGEYQLGRDLSDEDVASIVAFFDSLTGEIDAEYIAKPELPG